VDRLELVEPRSELLVRSSHGRIRLLLVARPVFGSGKLCLNPLVGVCRAVSFDVGEGTVRSMHVSVPFYVTPRVSGSTLLRFFFGFFLVYSSNLAYLWRHINF